MTHLLAAPGAVVAALEVSGIRATSDPRNVAPPGVWVEYRSGERLTSSKVSCDVDAMIVVPGPANGDALRALDILAAEVMAALDVAGLPWTESTLGSVGSPTTGDPLPALTLTITTTQEA